jgi:hypothetical protein
VIITPTGYKPREGQALLHRKMKRFNVLNLHRRYGKSVMCVNHMIHHLMKTHNKNPQGAYIAQNYGSAERIIWTYLKEYTEAFPGVKKNEQKLTITIPRPDKSDVVKIILLGSEKYDSIRGIYLDAAVFDEFAFSQPNAWFEVVRAALSDRNGWAIIISTPDGRNHFYDIYQKAEQSMREDPCSEWFACTIRASESGIIADKELKALRFEIGEEAYQQEFECSFFSQVKGAYYKDQIERLRELNQIRNFPIDTSHETHVSFDLGVGDSTALWFFQLVSKEVHIIDCYEDSGKGLDFYVKLIRDKPYILGELVLPHDATVRELGTGLSRVETLRKLGVSRMRVLPRQPIEDGINAVRMTLPRCFFHEANTVRGVECLYAYHKEFNEKMQVFVNKPQHDWSSHFSDSFRYLCLSLQRLESKSGYNRASLPRSSESSYDVLGV